MIATHDANTTTPLVLEESGDEIDSTLTSDNTHAAAQVAAQLQRLTDLDIDPLGLQAGNPVIFHRLAGEILVIRNSKESLSKIGWDRLLTLRSKVQRDGSVVPDLDLAFEIVRSACEKLGPYSPQAVRGPGLWLDSSGKLVVNDGLHCWRDGQVTYVPDGIPFLKAAASPLSRECVTQLFDQIDCAWGHRAATMMIGWLVIAVAGGALAWRPHLSLTGQYSSGKSAAQTMLTTILGAAAVHIDGDTTAAGIRQRVRTSCRAVIIDELEPEVIHERKDSILALLRTAASGGCIARGTADGAGQIFSMHSAFCIGAISPLLGGGADQTRIISLELNSLPGSHRLQLETYWLAEFGQHLLRSIVCDFPGLQASIARAKSRLRAKGRHARFQDTIGTMAGAAGWLIGVDVDLAVDSEMEERFSANDSMELYYRILGIPLRCGRPASEALFLVDEADHHIIRTVTSELACVGMCRRDHDGVAGVFISSRNDELKNYLRQDNWNAVLKRLPGALLDQNINVGATRRRGIWLPHPDAIAEAIEASKAAATQGNA